MRSIPVLLDPTDPERTVIPGASRVVSQKLSCQPCYQRDCPLRHHRCMDDISVDEVFNAAMGLFATEAVAETVEV